MTERRTAEERANEAVVERMRQVYATGDFSQIERVALEYYTEDTIDTFPQSGEVFRGRSLAEAMSAAYNDATGTKPTFALREIRGRDDLWVVEGTIDYGNGSTAESVSIAELRNGKIVRQTDYFASPFDAPDWRRPFRQAPE
jgi:ketosteroid isomerase-like protein